MRTACKNDSELVEKSAPRRVNEREGPSRKSPFASLIRTWSTPTSRVSVALVTRPKGKNSQDFSLCARATKANVLSLGVVSMGTRKPCFLKKMSNNSLFLYPWVWLSKVPASSSRRSTEVLFVSLPPFWPGLCIFSPFAPKDGSCRRVCTSLPLFPVTLRTLTSHVYRGARRIPPLRGFWLVAKLRAPPLFL